MATTRNTERPLSARSVVASTLLGMRPPRLPTQILVRSGALFGIAEGTTRVALSRMVAAGELERRRRRLPPRRTAARPAGPPGPLPPRRRRPATATALDAAGRGGRRPRRPGPGPAAGRRRPPCGWPSSARACGPARPTCPPASCPTTRRSWPTSAVRFTADARRRPRPPRRRALGPRRVGGPGHRAAPAPRRGRRRARPRATSTRCPRASCSPRRPSATSRPTRSSPTASSPTSWPGAGAAGRLRRVRRRLQDRVAGLVPRPGAGNRRRRALGPAVAFRDAGRATPGDPLTRPDPTAAPPLALRATATVARWSGRSSSRSSTSSATSCPSCSSARPSTSWCAATSRWSGPSSASRARPSS